MQDQVRLVRILMRVSITRYSTIIRLRIPLVSLSIINEVPKRPMISLTKENAITFAIFAINQIQANSYQCYHQF